MPANDNHHFVPRFLLESWTSSVDHKLSAYRRIHQGALESKRRSPKAVAKVLGLYASRSFANKNYVETDYVTPVIDNPGALAYQILIASGISALTNVQRADWVRFVVALYFRGPDTMRKVQEKLDAETGGDPMTLIRNRDPENRKRDAKAVCTQQWKVGKVVCTRKWWGPNCLLYPKGQAG